MITKFKIYEEINRGRPEIGDYVIVEFGPVTSDSNHFFPREHVENNIGEIIDYGFAKYYIKYENLPREDKIIEIFRKDIKYCSKNIEDLEMFITSKKYNL